MSALRRACAATAVIAAAILAPMALAPSPAGAQVTGGCSATINGQDVGSARSARSAIEVDVDDTVVVVGNAPGPITSYRVYLTFAGIRFEAAQGEVTDGSTSYTTDVQVSDYARYGVGLYRVEGETTGTVCSTWAYVNVTGRFPLFTAAGAVGAGLTLAGLFGMARSAIRPSIPGGMA
jgi:hypothetical protein